MPALAADPEVLEAAQDGFATVVKLPLRDDAAGAAARQQISALADAGASAPILLFPDADRRPGAYCPVTGPGRRDRHPDRRPGHHFSRRTRA